MHNGYGYAFKMLPCDFFLAAIRAWSIPFPVVFNNLWRGAPKRNFTPIIEQIMFTLPKADKLRPFLYFLRFFSKIFIYPIFPQAVAGCIQQYPCCWPDRPSLNL